MRAVMLSVLLLAPVAAGAYHYGPGQEQLRLDATQDLLAEARRQVAAGEDGEAVELFSAALERLPGDRIDETRRVRLERAKAMLQSQRLPEAYDELTLLLPELEDDPTVDAAVVSETREALANAKYYLTWLMRLEGEPRTAWEPEIEASRQYYRLLAEDARAANDSVSLERHQADLEAAIRLARMDLSELQALPLPSQCKGCCSGQCQCKGGKGKKSGNGTSQKKPDSDEFARGASSGPPLDNGGN